MEVLEIKEQLLDLRSQMESIIATGEKEERKLDEGETNALATLRSQIADLEKELADKEAENRNIANNKIENKENKIMKEVRLFDLIKNVAEGNQMDEAQARYMKNGNTISTRATIKATVEGAGQENVPEEKLGLDAAIRNASVLNKLGCTWFSNAVGDLSIPRYAGSNVAWKGESVAAEDGASAFTETILSPKRLTAYIDISKQFLAQDSNDAEAILIADLAAAIAEKLDMTVFGTEASGDTKPGGLFYGADSEAVGLSDMTYENVLALEEAVEEKNGTSFIFVTNPKIKYQLKGTQMAHGLQMVFNNGEIDGIKTVVSNSVAGIACLDPRDLAVATWSGVEITVDTTSRAIYNEVRIVVNFLVDAKLRGDRVAVLATK